MSYGAFFSIPPGGEATILNSIISSWTGTQPSQVQEGGGTERNIHIFKLDLQHLTDSGESAGPSDGGLFTPPPLGIACEQINGGAGRSFSGSVLIARHNIKDV